MHHLVTSRVKSNINSTLKLSYTLVFACAVQVWYKDSTLKLSYTLVFARAVQGWYNDVFAQVAEMFV